VVSIGWVQALAWRMRRHLLDPVGQLPVEDVVRRLCGVQAQLASSAELAVRVRSQAPPGEVGRTLSDGRLIKTWAMRGTLHLLTAEEAGGYLALMAAGRSWERPSWQRAFGLNPGQMDELRVVVREALDGTVLTREQLIEAVVAAPGLDHVEEGLRSGWGTVLKPLAWHGDLCFGPNQGTRVTFMRPEDASPSWVPVTDPDEAAPTVIAAYFGAYGPATMTNFGNWLSRGRIAAAQMRRWRDAMGDRLVAIDVDGEPALVLAEDLDDLASTKPTTAVRLLPGFDQYVLGAGTEDGHVVPARRRAAVSRQSGWISPVVVSGGVVSGTWEIEAGSIRIAWFGEAGRPPRRALQAEGARLGSILDIEPRVAISLA
jgi:hypothetical protein